MTTYIHVDQDAITANKRDDGFRPVITVMGRVQGQCHEVVVNGPSRVVHRPYAPMLSGATVWIETEEDVELVTLEDASRKPRRVEGKR